MIPTTVKTDPISQQQARTVAPVKPAAPVTPVDAVADPSNTQHEFILGQKYQALIEKRLPNGNFSVLISNRLVQMQLPEGFQPGDNLELLLLSNESRLKFALQNENQANSKSNASISPAGKFLNILIQDTGKLTANSSAPAPPILTGPPINKQDFPFLLQKAIHQSGLFYESHLAKWVNGRNSLEKLQLEPQNKLKTPVNESSPVTNSATSVLSVSTQNASLIQQQLMALETGHILWRGEIWNGQQMEWAIYEDTGDNAPDTSTTTARWRTTLTLDFPALGKITAAITLNAQDIQIKLSADHPETQQLLINSQTSLKTNLQTAGLPVTSFALHSNE